MAGGQAQLHSAQAPLPDGRRGRVQHGCHRPRARGVAKAAQALLKAVRRGALSPPERRVPSEPELVAERWQVGLQARLAALRSTTRPGCEPGSVTTKLQLVYLLSSCYFSLSCTSSKVCALSLVC